MKKIAIMVFVGALALASCKKNRNCKCVHTDGEVEKSIVVNETKRSAKNICSAKSTTQRSCELE